MSEAIANDSLDIPPLHEGLDVVQTWIDEWTVLTVRDGTRLVGAARGRLVGDTWDIGRLMVAPDRAGQGLGRRLLDQIERLAPPGVRTYELFTGTRSARNIDLYRRAGYTVSEAPAPRGAIILRKAVAAR